MATKPKKVAEFIDYDSGDAWLNAGRNHDLRPTSDAWNTQLRRDGTRLELTLKNQKGIYESLITYEKGEARFFFASEFPQIERINRYLCQPLNMLLVEGVLIGPGPILTGGIQSRVTIAEGRSSDYVEINTDTGALLSGGMSEPEPLDRHILLKQFIAPYAKRVLDHIQGDGIFMMGTCPMCVPISGVPGEASQGEYLRDSEHVFAHIFSGMVPGEMLQSYLQWRSGKAAVTTFTKPAGASTIKVEDKYTDAKWLSKFLDYRTR